MVTMEVRCDPNKLVKTFGLYGFDFVQPSGYSCGIVVRWKKHSVDVVVILKHFQFLHLDIQFQDVNK